MSYLLLCAVRFSYSPAIEENNTNMAHRLVKRLSVSSNKLSVSALRCLSTKKGGKGGEKGLKKPETEALYNFYNAATESLRVKLPYSEAELAEHKKIADEYNRQYFIRDNQIQKDLTDKLWLMQEAIRALPEHLRAHATTIDTTPAPERTMPFWDTPPIQDFDIRKYVQTSDVSGKVCGSGLMNSTDIRKSEDKHN